MSAEETELTWYQKVVPGFIRRRFTAKFMVIVLVAMVVAAGVGAFFFLQTNNTLEDQVREDVDQTAQLQSNVLINWISGLESETRTLARAAAFQGETPDEVQSSLDEMTFRDDISNVHYINATTTEITASTGIDLQGVPFESLDVPWISNLDSIRGEVQDGNTVFISDTPYTSVTGDDTIAFVTSPPNRDDRLLIVEAAVTSDRLGFDSSRGSGYISIHDPQTGVGEFVFDGSPEDTPISSNLSEMTESDIVENEVIALSQVQGTDWTVVAHVPKSEAFSLRDQIGATLIALIVVPLVIIGLAVAVIGRRTGKTLSSLTERAEKVRDGNLEVSFETSRADEIGRLAMAFDDVRESLKTRIQEAESARKEAEVSRAEAMELSNYLQETADEYAEIMQQCGAGDLTKRMEADGENEAMDRIATEFNDMIDELEKTTGQLKSFSGEVERAGKEVQQSAETVRDAAEQVAESIQRISDDAYDQQEQIEEASHTIDEIADDLESFAAEHEEVDMSDSLDRIEEIANMLNDLVEINEETMAESENVAGAAEEQAAELNEVSDRASDLTRYANPLREVLDRFDTESEHEFYFPTGPGSPPNED